MKSWFVLVVSVILSAATIEPLCEEPAPQPTPGIPVAVVQRVAELPFKVKAQYWRSDGSAMFRDVGFDPMVGLWESELEFPMEGDFVIFGAEYSFLAERVGRFAVDLNYGFSEDLEGTTKDWDWVWDDPEPLVYAESDTDGDSDFLTTNVYYRLMGWGPKNSVDVFVGYHNQENSFTNTNGRVLTPVYFAAAGKVAEYEMKINGVRAGLRMELALWPRFSIEGNLAFIPFADFEAEGKWLFRDLSFSQSADGYGVDFDLLLDFEVTKNIDIVAGLKYLFLRATDGEESGVSEGIPYGPFGIVDEMESDQFGGTAGILVKF